MLASRTRSFAASGTASARAAARSAAAAGREIIDLTAGELLAELAPALRTAAIDAIDRGENRYTDTTGLPELRRAVAHKLSGETGQLWSSEEVAVTAGAKQALFNAAMVLLDPGDEVLIPAPYWTTFPAQVVIAGGRPVFIDTRASSFVPRIEALQAAITPATRAIIVNTPGNPSGAIYDPATLGSIAELASRHQLWVIFDECYGAFAHAPSEHRHVLSLAPEARARVLIVNAFSKNLAITGWRIGFVAGPREVIQAIKALQSHTTSNPNVIAQHAVLGFLNNDDGNYQKRLRARLTAARTRGLELLSSLTNVPLPRAQGGFYFYLDLSALLRPCGDEQRERSADDVAEFLLDRAGVACVSGTAFGDSQGLRISYGVPIERLETGLRRMVEALNEFH